MRILLGHIVNNKISKIYFTTEKLPVSLISSEEVPIKTLKLPGSTTKLLRVFHIPNSCGVSVKVTVVSFSLLRCILSNPINTLS